jgi:hypothetical protein
MDVILHTIESRSKLSDVHPASLQHFTLTNPVTVSSQIIVDEAGWTPYCLDHERQQAIFVQVEPEVDISEAAFSHLKQYHEAKRLVIVAYDELENLASQLEPPKHYIFTFSMARCGSTLAHRLLNLVEGVWSLSEPDVFVSESFGRKALGVANEDEQISLLKACTRLLFRPPDGNPSQTLAIKFRSQMLFSANLLYRAFPDASNIFMYRDGLSWANSFYRFFRTFNLPQNYDMEARELIWWILSNGLETNYLEPFVDFQAEIVYPEQLLAPAWALHMEEYIKHYENGIPFLALHYNELNRDHEKLTTQLLEHCKLPVSELSKTLTAFDEDSQAGTQLARDREVDSFTEENYARFKETLAKHPRFNHPDMLLPDIYHPKQGSL